MKLNSEKNIMLCQKALYSKQLQYYSKLCSLYSDLAKLQGPDTTPDEVQETYSEALSLAAKGDLSFLESENDIYSENEIDIFKKYAFCSDRLSQFKEAASILKGSIIRFSFEEPEFDLTAIERYKNYMQNTSKSTKLFDKFISESSPRLIGHNYYLATRKSINTIDEIDNSHLNSKAFSKILTPTAFGATIKGVKKHVHTIDKPEVKTPSEVRDEAYNIFEKDEKREYAKTPNLAVESAYVLGQRAKTGASNFYKANKTAVRVSIAAIATSAALLGGALHVNNINTYNNLTSRSTEYESYISNETKTELENIRSKLTSYQNIVSNSDELNYKDLEGLRTELDDVINLVLSDLTKSAFETANPDCEVTSVETMYDRTTNIHTGPNAEPNPEHFCTINYVDKNGEDKSVVVTEFDSFSMFAKNSIHKAYLNEYDLDHSHPNHSSTNTDFEALLNTYESVLNDTEHLAGTKMIYSNGIVSPSLKTVIPEKNPENNDKTVNDNEER